MGGAKMRNTRYGEPYEGVAFGPHGLSKVNVIAGARLQINPDSQCTLSKLITVPSLGHCCQRIRSVSRHREQ